MAERSYPTSKVRGRSREDPMPEGRPPRGVTPRPRSGAAARRSNPTPETRGGGREDQPHVQGRSGRAAVRRYPLSKVRSIGCALLEQP